MNRFEREIFEIHAHLVVIFLRDHLAHGLSFGLAVGTLEIAENHHDHFGARSSKAGLKIGLDLIEIGLERTLVDVVDIALSHDFVVQQELLCLLGENLDQ